MNNKNWGGVSSAGTTGSCGVFSLNWCLIQQRAFTLPVNAKPSMNGVTGAKSLKYLLTLLL